MKLTLKTVVVLAALMAAGTAYAEVPDVSKWVCPNGVIDNDSDYGVEYMNCDTGGSGNLYLKVSGELVYVHEHRMDQGKTVYYNALKTNEGKWVETINTKDLVYSTGEVASGVVVVDIVDDDDKIVAQRSVPRLK